jgi:hypothetical protein
MDEMTSQEERDEEQLKHGVERKEALSKAERRLWSNNNNGNLREFLRNIYSPTK